MKKHLIKLATVTMVLVAGVSLAACGGAPAAKPSTPSPTPAPAPTQADPAALRAKGQEIFQKTKGCFACHGADGKGTPNVAPAVRGESADDIKRALGGDAMSSISMTEEEIQAVAAYLQYLQSQP